MLLFYLDQGRGRRAEAARRRRGGPRGLGARLGVGGALGGAAAASKAAGLGPKKAVRQEQIYFSSIEVCFCVRRIAQWVRPIVLSRRGACGSVGNIFNDLCTL